MDIADRLAALGHNLPPKPAAGGNYLPFRQVGSVIYLSGVISVTPTGLIEGKVGADLTVAEGQAAARACALNALAVLHEAAAGRKVKQIVSLSGYVNGPAGFPDAPSVINGASDFLVEVLGEAGRHARAAVTVAGLPKNAAVEIQVVAELE